MKSLKQLAIIALTVGGLAACDDNDGSPLDVVSEEELQQEVDEPAATTSFVGLLGRVFLKNENDEPVPVNGLTIEDDADENSFSSHHQGY